MSQARGVPVSGGGALETGANVGSIIGTFTTSTGVFTQTKGPKGFTLGSFTSGVATLTFPTSLSYLNAWGQHDTDSATAANRRSLRVGTVSLSAGTATVRLILDSDGSTDTSHTIGTGTLRLDIFYAD
jgi:hypothetical protein